MLWLLYRHHRDMEPTCDSLLSLFSLALLKSLVSFHQNRSLCGMTRFKEQLKTLHITHDAQYGKEGLDLSDFGETWVPNPSQRGSP